MVSVMSVMTYIIIKDNANNIVGGANTNPRKDKG
jgi:hypothetical protein